MGDVRMITEIEEETVDLDWFCIDDDGEIAHFASGGRGFLPPSVKESRANLDRLAAYFRRDLPPNGSGGEAKNLSAHKRFTSSKQKTRYLDDYLLMGSRGLYSLTCIMGATRPTNYFLVIVPSNPLRVEDLPDDI